MMPTMTTMTCCLPPLLQPRPKTRNPRRARRGDTLPTTDFPGFPRIPGQLAISRLLCTGMHKEQSLKHLAREDHTQDDLGQSRA